MYEQEKPFTSVDRQMAIVYKWISGASRKICRDCTVCSIIANNSEQCVIQQIDTNGIQRMDHRRECRIKITGDYYYGYANANGADIHVYRQSIFDWKYIVARKWVSGESTSITSVFFSRLLISEWINKNVLGSVEKISRDYRILNIVITVSDIVIDIPSTTLLMTWIIEYH